MDPMNIRNDDEASPGLFEELAQHSPFPIYKHTQNSECLGRNLGDSKLVVKHLKRMDLVGPGWES